MSIEPPATPSTGENDWVASIVGIGTGFGTVLVAGTLAYAFLIICGKRSFSH